MLVDVITVIWFDYGRVIKTNCFLISWGFWQLRRNRPTNGKDGWKRRCSPVILNFKAADSGEPGRWPVVDDSAIGLLATN